MSLYHRCHSCDARLLTKPCTVPFGATAVPFALQPWLNALNCADAGGGNKFVVRRHRETGLYVTLSNPQTPESRQLDQRNVLVLAVSPDLVSWRRRVWHILRTYGALRFGEVCEGYGPWSMASGQGVKCYEFCPQAGGSGA